MNFTKDDLEDILYSLEGYIQGNDDEDELVDKISDTLGWCIKKIDYTSNLIHPLTSYL